MANPLPFQHANTVCYSGDFSSLPDHLVDKAAKELVALTPQTHHSDMMSLLPVTNISPT
jgi:hypothetical protein